MAAIVPWVADALVVLGLLILTITVGGVLRTPDLSRSIHVASLGTTLGVGPLVVAAGLENGTILLRGLLVLVFLLLTAPVASHSIARAHLRDEERDARAAAVPGQERARR